MDNNLNEYLPDICFTNYTSALFSCCYMNNNHKYLLTIFFTNYSSAMVPDVCVLHETQPTWFPAICCSNYTNALFSGDVIFLRYMKNNRNYYLHEIWFTNYTSALFSGCYMKSNHNAYCLRSFLPTTSANCLMCAIRKTVTHSHARFA